MKKRVFLRSKKLRRSVMEEKCGSLKFLLTEDVYLMNFTMKYQKLTDIIKIC